jgi:hypothetical protein
MKQGSGGPAASGSSGSSARNRAAAWVATLSLLLGCLIALPWEPNLDTEFVRDRSYDEEGPNAPYVETAAFIRTAERIDSHGTEIEAWVYVPKGLSK